jgi:hypothetical protein
MEKMNNCFNDDLKIELKASKRPRFKAGAELSGKVNLVGIEVNQETTEEAELIEVKFAISSEICEKPRPGNCK